MATAALIVAILALIEGGAALVMHFPRSRPVIHAPADSYATCALCAHTVARYKVNGKGVVCANCEAAHAA